jgi:predicted NUDIX family phosphoesterase
VLCLPRKKIPEQFVRNRASEKLSWEEAVSILYNGSCVFLPKGKAEKSTSYKQLSPYVIIRNIRGDLLCYKRSNCSNENGEQQCFLGISGHVKKEDFGESPKKSKIQEAVHQASERELKEEVGIRDGFGSLSFLGIVNEEESDTGKKHLGVVYEFHLSPHGVIHLGKELTNPHWVSPEEITDRNEQFEPWAFLSLNLIEED